MPTLYKASGFCVMAKMTGWDPWYHPPLCRWISKMNLPPTHSRRPCFHLYPSMWICCYDSMDLVLFDEAISSPRGVKVPEIDQKKKRMISPVSATHNDSRSPVSPHPRELYLPMTLYSCCALEVPLERPHIAIGWAVPEQVKSGAFLGMVQQIALLHKIAKKVADTIKKFILNFQERW